MLTHDNDNFPSDVFTMMAAVGATVTIGQSGGHAQTDRQPVHVCSTTASTRQSSAGSGIYVLFPLPLSSPLIASFPVRLHPSLDVSVGLPEAGHG